MLQFAHNAAARGIKVIITAAGGAAYLPGMIASSTSLSVIWAPVKGSAPDGMVSVLSIVQMPVSYDHALSLSGNTRTMREKKREGRKEAEYPLKPSRGVPVATVAINNSINAALLTARILCASDLGIRRRLESYSKDMESNVIEKAVRLGLDGGRVCGSEKYGEPKQNQKKLSY
jgi:phosphoribosylaminoimidazole carboxylase